MFKKERLTPVKESAAVRRRISQSLLGGNHHRATGAGGHGTLLRGLAGAGTKAEGDEAEGDQFDEFHGYRLLVWYMTRTARSTMRVDSQDG